MAPLKKKRITNRMPLFTMGLVLSSVVGSVFPDIRNAFIYDREAIFQGEVWRLLTGNLIHLSASHLFYDIVFLGVVGWRIESKRYPYYRQLCIFSAIIIGLALLLFEPDMYFYGGMSGIACAIILYLGMMGLLDYSPERFIYLGVVVVTLFKIGFEWFTGKPIFASEGLVPFKLVPLAHVMGAFTALGACLWYQRHKKIDVL